MNKPFLFFVLQCPRQSTQKTFRLFAATEFGRAWLGIVTRIARIYDHHRLGAVSHAIFPLYDGDVLLHLS